MSVATTWGTESSERTLGFPCDAYVDHPAAVYYRGVSVHAPAPTVFRWLCQLRAAPYSYDWIDNGGRRSPPTLTCGLDHLEIGQAVMRIFRLVEFERDRHLTVVLEARRGVRVFGELALTYMVLPQALVLPQAAERCRLLAKIVVRYPRGPRGWLMRAFLPWGDLVMMRRQLLNLKRLAERPE